MFKPGDIVICINALGLYSVTHNNRYDVISFDEYTHGIRIKNNYNLISWYDPSRFILDIKTQRKQKLKEICSNQEIE